MAAKKSHDQFLMELQKRNKLNPDNQIELISGQQYTGLDEPLTFKCLNGHKNFTTLPRYIIQKQTGCPICGAKRAGNKNIKTNESFIDKLNKRNMIYSPVMLAPSEQYKGVHTKIAFVCGNPKHSSWLATPASILQGHGCPECGKEKSRQTHQHNHSQFVELLLKRNVEHPHKKVYLADGEIYTQQNSKLKFTCDKGHIWSTLPGDVIHRKIGCPFCASSKTFSFMAIEWLTQIERNENITIIHRGNSDKEYVLPGTKYTVDGYCKENNTVYEFYGNYWHGNPRIYKKEDINERAKMTFGELYDNTIKKENAIKEMGYNLITMWEDEFDNIKQQQIQFDKLKEITKNLSVDVIVMPIDRPYDRLYYVNQLNTAIHNNKPTIFIFNDELNNIELISSKLKHYNKSNNATRIHARQCDIVQITNKHKKDFLDKYHVQGNHNADIAYGAYYNDNLVAVMTFCKPRIALGQKNKQNNEQRWELSRFCTDVNYRIPGIASKLLTYFKRNYHWDEIYSYADRRWSVGNLYETLGFTLDRINPPDYFYVVNGVRKHRWNYRKDILKTTLPNYDPNLTEYQNMVNHGFWRVWDCGTLRYSLKNI
jgi:hypothetical protein